MHALRNLFLIVWGFGMLSLVALGFLVVVLKWMRRPQPSISAGGIPPNSIVNQTGSAALRKHNYLFTPDGVYEIKPLPAAIRTICTCICGRVIPQYELHCLIAPPKCPLCGSTLRRWEYVYPTWFDKLAAAFRMMIWKRRHNKKRWL